MSRAPLLPAADPITSLPVLVLEVSGSCSCRCLMCDLWLPDRQDQPAAELDLELIRSWIPGWGNLGVTRIGLTGGEPLLHSDPEGLLELLGRAGFALTLMTSGTRLEQHADSVAHWCDTVVVSLDGPAAVHDTIRRLPGSLAALSAGVTALRANHRRPRIMARCTVQRANLGQLVAAVETARAMALDAISFLPVDTSSGPFGRSSGSDQDPRLRELRPGVEALDRLADELEVVARSNPGFVSESSEALHERILGHFRAEAGLAVHCADGHRARPCNAPWVSAVISTGGMARPCFFLPAYGRLEPGAELATVLNGPKSQEQRHRLDVVNDPVCRRCVCPLALRRDEDP